MPFSNDARYYEIDGKKLPSVTTILGVVAKPALYGWYEKKGTQKMFEVLSLLQAIKPEVYSDLVKRLPAGFLMSGTDISDDAKGIGTRIHKLVEQISLGQVVSLEENEDERVKAALEQYLIWQENNPHEVVKTESVVHSKKHEYAGTLDAIMRFPSGVMLVDYKTSKGIWDEYLMQVVAYKKAAEEMTGKRIGDCLILRFGKDGSFEDRLVKEKDHAGIFKAFLSAVHLWRWVNAQKEKYLAGKGQGRVQKSNN